MANDIYRCKTEGCVNRNEIFPSPGNCPECREPLESELQNLRDMFGEDDGDNHLLEPVFA